MGETGTQSDSGGVDGKIRGGSLGWTFPSETGRPASSSLYGELGFEREESETMRVGIGHDTHRLVEGRPLILGGVAIEHSRGLLGHSDADVVLHAVADALLGAAALGDIGEHFPDTDPKWEGLDGGRLLADVVEMVALKGWVVGNCDVVIHAQAPKLLPHKPRIRANIAELLRVGPDAVNVKAKTGEHVGPIGREEAIACEVAVLLARPDGLGTQD